MPPPPVARRLGMCPGSSRLTTSDGTPTAYSAAAARPSASSSAKIHAENSDCTLKQCSPRVTLSHPLHSTVSIVWTGLGFETPYHRQRRPRSAQYAARSTGWFSCHSWMRWYSSTRSQPSRLPTSIFERASSLRPMSWSSVNVIV